MFVLIDCNNFFASCERLFRPDLQNQPIVVLSNNDGCVIARSNEAKALGIGMGEPFFKVRALCQQRRVHVFSSNYALYGDLSERVMAVIQDAWEETEIYSVDEAFLNMQTLPEHLIEEFCDDLQKKILRATGIPTSIGIGSTKTLAKAANCIAKKKLKIPVFFIKNPSYWLKELAVGEVWGVGWRGEKNLQRLGIHSAFDLFQLDVQTIKKQFNVCLVRTILELKGQICLDLRVFENSKSILSSRSFGTVQTEYQALRQAVSMHCNTAWEKLRQQQLKAKHLSVFAYASPYNSALRHHSHSASIEFLHATDDIRIITQYANTCLQKLYQSNVPYKKCGIYLSELSDKSMQQYDLFDNAAEAPLEHAEKIMQTIEAINHKYQSKAIHLAAEGMTKPWAMKSTLRTQAYTTKWTELATAYAR